MLIEEPQRASEFIITRCRREIEGRMKATIRAILIPIFRIANGFAEIGEGFQGPRSGRVKVGRGSRVGRYVYMGPRFESHAPVVIGDLCLISRDCVVIGDDHDFHVAGTPTRLGFPTTPRAVTVIGMDVWIGACVLIKEGVRIGEGAVIGARSLVTRDVPPYTIVAGVPARTIRQRFTTDELILHRQKLLND